MQREDLLLTCKYQIWDYEKPIAGFHDQRSAVVAFEEMIAEGREYLQLNELHPVAFRTHVGNCPECGAKCRLYEREDGEDEIYCSKCKYSVRDTEGISLDSEPIYAVEAHIGNIRKAKEKNDH